jgi:uncharacterized protein
VTIKKIVLDTNIYISAIFYDGIAKQCVDFIHDKGCILVISMHILGEVFSVVREKYSANQEHAYNIFNNLIKGSELARFDIVSTNYTQDMADNLVIETAVISKADFLVTGDKAILDLKKIGNTKIISLRDMLEILEK